MPDIREALEGLEKTVRRIKEHSTPTIQENLDGLYGLHATYLRKVREWVEAERKRNKWAGEMLNDQRAEIARLWEQSADQREADYFDAQAHLGTESGIDAARILIPPEEHEALKAEIARLREEVEKQKKNNEQLVEIHNTVAIALYEESTKSEALTATLEEAREELKITEKQHRDCYRQLNYERIENYKLSQKLKTPLRKDTEIARFTSTLEEARRLVDEGIAAGNHGRLDLIRSVLSGKGEGAPATCPDLDVCSFCGRHKESGVKIIVGPRVTICSDCVGNAVEHLKTWPEIPPPDPVCTHCGDTICPMCRPPPNPLCEHCGISSRVGPIDHSPDCPLNPKGCKPEGES